MTDTIDTKLQTQSNIKKTSCSIEFEKEKCIKCTKCVLRCKKNVVDHLKMSGEGKERYLDDTENKCTLCGQCTIVCPINAMREQSQINEVKQVLADKTKTVIVQCAPSVRSSVNEIFKLEHNINIEKKINTACRKLGFSKVFDVNFGADITTMVEAEELIERLEKNKKLPMFTSCCPAWIQYVELFHPELKPNLTTARSPHIHSGIAYKTWWAELENIDPKNIIVVSIMPCTAKKHEANLESSKINGLKAVDYVLTVREFGRLLQENNIDLNNIEESESDMLGEYSGAGVIYGTSGGVMESALRTSYYKLTNKNLNDINLTSVRSGFDGYKTACINIEDKTINVAVVSGINNVKKILDELKEEPNKYQYIEVMNCVGGCINGGGQPLLPMKPADEITLIEKRKNVLYSLDTIKTKRKAHENKLILEYLNWLSKNEKLKVKALHNI